MSISLEVVNSMPKINQNLLSKFHNRHAIDCSLLFSDVNSYDVAQYQFMIALLFTKLLNDNSFIWTKSLILFPYEVIFKNASLESQIIFKYKQFEAVYTLHQLSNISVEYIKISDLVLRILTHMRNKIWWYDAIIKLLENWILKDNNPIDVVHKHEMCLN